MEKTAIIYCEGQFGTMDGKTANGLVRNSKKYLINGVIDSTKDGLDAGKCLDGRENGIPIFCSLSHAIGNLPEVPDYFIYGIAPANAFLQVHERSILFEAMELGMNIVNPLQEFLTEDEDFIKFAALHNVEILDIRKPPSKKDMGLFSGQILSMPTPVVAVLGTDGAIGKRTTSVLLEKALLEYGIKAVLVATGQTGLIQGAKYGVAIDAIPFQFMIGEIEKEVIKAYENEQPDIIIVEGQGALSHPAYISSAGIIRGARPGAIIVQHAPKRENLGDFDYLKMPKLESEIELIETFSKSKVIAITINHERMSDQEINSAIHEYEQQFHIPATDVLKHGCDKLVISILEKFPQLKDKVETNKLVPQ
ncbi:DUF1611 domain-containing protein [Paenibacillus agricola]|uniref:DUF1611 domain-containing protein n=1 Tax=Paenibacillus agricola TaxID=2716264 RepID=A0ABX0JBC4_9BACL|nr:DUF1611 domain-containing protein [Paenibacillus agricola]NHN33248.1 DUF1611 domain-containing protein [Paenibacillus agricola]